MSTERMPQDDIDAIADTVVQKIEQKYGDEFAWARRKLEQEQAFKGARGRIIERTVGSVAIVSVIGFIAWIGHSALATLQDMLGRGGPP